MDFEILCLYQEDFLAGRISPSELRIQLQGFRIPRKFSFDGEFLDVLLDIDTLPRERQNHPCVRSEERKDMDILRQYLEAFDREVLEGRRRSEIQREGSCFVLDVEHTVVGALWYYLEQGKRGIDLYVDRLYIDPLHRGKSYGELLTREVIAREKNHCQGVALFTPEHVIPFYKKLGFREEACFQDKEIGNKKFSCMYKKL
ncbi:MAG: GNAT family N-acetyltransferase [bacterium]|nr:GNAT family N-acetyltransferase [bacterium]